MSEDAKTWLFVLHVMNGRVDLAWERPHHLPAVPHQHSLRMNPLATAVPKKFLKMRAKALLNSGLACGCFKADSQSLAQFFSFGVVFLCRVGSP